MLRFARTFSLIIAVLTMTSTIPAPPSSAQLPPLIRDTARRLRREQTEWEHNLWTRLRRRQLKGFKFRRQHPIGPFFADFFCPEAKLVIEIDGSQHGDELASDESRTEFLRDAGYKVLRFWNYEISGEIDAP